MVITFTSSYSYSFFLRLFVLYFVYNVLVTMDVSVLNSIINMIIIVAQKIFSSRFQLSLRWDSNQRSSDLYNDALPTELVSKKLETTSCLLCYHRFSLTCQWHIQRLFENTVFTKGFWGRSPKGHNCDIWRITFCYKHVWMTWVGAFYYGKCNYYVLINCIKHCVRGELIQRFFVFY